MNNCLAIKRFIRLTEIVRGDKLGRCYTVEYIYTNCSVCKKKWWAVYVKDKKEYKCLSCSMKGRVYSEEHNKKVSLAKLGKKLPARNPDSLDSSSSPVHQWIRYHYGKADHCEICSSTNRKLYQWANTKGNRSNSVFSRRKSDYIMACHHCHRRLDAFIIKNEYKLPQPDIVREIERMKNEFSNRNN